MAITEELRCAIERQWRAGRQRRQKPLPDIGRFVMDLTMRADREIPSKAWRAKLEAVVKHRDDLGAKERRQLAASLRAAAHWLQDCAARLVGEE
jgi:hypothetical protein